MSSLPLCPKPSLEIYYSWLPVPKHQQGRDVITQERDAGRQDTEARLNVIKRSVWVDDIVLLASPSERKDEGLVEED